MSLDAIRIVKEEIQRRINSIPDIHCAHARLEELGDKITHRIFDELVELDEGTIQETYSSLGDEDVPKCKYCTTTAVYEGWTNKLDLLAGRPSGTYMRIFVCGEHKDQLKGHDKKSRMRDHMRKGGDPADFVP